MHSALVNPRAKVGRSRGPLFYSKAETAQHPLAAPSKSALRDAQGSPTKEPENTLRALPAQHV